MLPSEELQKIKNKRSEWEKENLSKFVQRGEREEKFETPSGIPLKHVYCLLYTSPSPRDRS